MAGMLEHAQHLAVDLGWPVLPIRPKGKTPLTVHGVLDATVDERTILHWFDQWPDANVAVSTGLPGPSVLDIDRPQDAMFLLAQLHAGHPPEVATARGRHLYYAGTNTGTVNLEFGELRGRGSYVVCPPSIHPDGKIYTWLVEPTGRLLPAVPDVLATLGHPAGTGTMPPLPLRTGRVGHGQRHDHLKDMAVRLARSGITDPATIERALKAEYEAVCDHDPPARRDEFTSLAQWAAGTRIAARERAPALLQPTPGGGLSDHRRVVDDAGGWAPLSVSEVRRYGNREVDTLHIHLTNGQVIEFDHQSDIVTRGRWGRNVIGATDGHAHPPAMKDHELLALYRSLCALAGKSRAQLAADEHIDLLTDLLGICEPLLGHTVTDAGGRYKLITTLKARPQWDPFDRNSLTQPPLVVDEETGLEYLRGGDLMTWFRYRGALIHTREFPGAMTMIGLVKTAVNGREPPGTGGRRARRPTNHTVLYQLTNQQEDEMTDQPTPEPVEAPGPEPVETPPEPDAPETPAEDQPAEPEPDPE